MQRDLVAVAGGEDVIAQHVAFARSVRPFGRASDRGRTHAVDTLGVALPAGASAPVTAALGPVARRLADARTIGTSKSVGAFAAGTVTAIVTARKTDTVRHALTGAVDASEVALTDAAIAATAICAASEIGAVRDAVVDAGPVGAELVAVAIAARSAAAVDTALESVARRHAITDAVEAVILGRARAAGPATAIITALSLVAVRRALRCAVAVRADPFGALAARPPAAIVAALPISAARLAAGVGRCLGRDVRGDIIAIIDGIHRCVIRCDRVDADLGVGRGVGRRRQRLLRSAGKESDGGDEDEGESIRHRFVEVDRGGSTG